MGLSLSPSKSPPIPCQLPRETQQHSPRIEVDNPVTGLLRRWRLVLWLPKTQDSTPTWHAVSKGKTVWRLSPSHSTSLPAEKRQVPSSHLLIPLSFHHSCLCQLDSSGESRQRYGALLDKIVVSDTSCFSCEWSDWAFAECYFHMKTAYLPVHNGAVPFSQRTSNKTLPCPAFLQLLIPLSWNDFRLAEALAWRLVIACVLTAKTYANPNCSSFEELIISNIVWLWYILESLR